MKVKVGVNLSELSREQLDLLVQTTKDGFGEHSTEVTQVDFWNKTSCPETPERSYRVSSTRGFPGQCGNSSVREWRWPEDHGIGISPLWTTSWLSSAQVGAPKAG